MTHDKNGAFPAPLRLIPLEVRLSDVFHDAGPLEEVTLVRTQERSEFPPGTPTRSSELDLGTGMKSSFPKMDM